MSTVTTHHAHIQTTLPLASVQVVVVEGEIVSGHIQIRLDKLDGVVDIDVEKAEALTELRDALTEALAFAQRWHRT